MAVNLGGWGWAVGMAIDFGAPMLGAAFGVPGLAGQAGQLLKRALGLAPNVSEETVRNAVEADPEAAKAAFAAANTEAAAKWEYLAKVVEAQAEVAKTQVSEVNETIRAETAAQAGKPNGWWGQRRTWMAYELTIECAGDLLSRCGIPAAVYFPLTIIFDHRTIATEPASRSRQSHKRPSGVTPGRPFCFFQ
jgi:hypothetical protein